jgi:hypothetical protein
MSSPLDDHDDLHAFAGQVSQPTPPTAEALARAEAAMVIAEAGCDALAARVAVADAAIAAARAAARLAGVPLAPLPTRESAASEETVEAPRRRAGHAPPTPAAVATPLESALRDALRGVVRDELEARPQVVASPTTQAEEAALLTVSKVASLGDVDEQTVRAWIRSGQLRAIFLGKGNRVLRIKPEDWRAFQNAGPPRTGRPNLDAVADDIIRRRRPGKK